MSDDRACMNFWTPEEIFQMVESGRYNPRVAYTTKSNVDDLSARIAALEAQVAELKERDEHANYQLGLQQSRAFRAERERDLLLLEPGNRLDAYREQGAALLAATIRAEAAERELAEEKLDHEGTRKFLGRFNEELVSAGFQGGDRAVGLENLRSALTALAAAKKELATAELRAGTAEAENEKLWKVVEAGKAVREALKWYYGLAAMRKEGPPEPYPGCISRYDTALAALEEEE